MAVLLQMAGLSAAVVVAVALAAILIIGGWYIVWRVFLSKFPFFRALFGFPDENNGSMTKKRSRQRKGQQLTPNQSLQSSLTSSHRRATGDYRQEDREERREGDT